MSAGSGETRSRQLLSCWAKSDKEEQSLSLVSHAADTSAVADYLYNHWLPPSLRRLIAGERGDDEARALVRWLAACHDAGKISPAFACQVPHLADAMRATGLWINVERNDKGRREYPHSLVSQLALETYLSARGWSRPKAARPFAVVVGGHHGVPPTSIPLSVDTKLYGGGEWEAVRTEFLDYAGRISGADQYLDSWKNTPLTPQQQAILTGLVIVADWLASNADLFPLGTPRDAQSHTAEILDRLALPPPWRATPVDDVAGAFARFGLAAEATPNPMQSAAVDLARAAGNYGLLIIEGQMGSGKSEAAMMAAQQFAAAAGLGGVFFGLPTMATANAMFTRELAWLQAQPRLGVTTVVLTHGKADLNDEFRGLSSTSRLADVDADCADDDAEVVAHQWLSGRKKGLLANFVVGTIDQLLFMALQARHLALRHLAFAGKVVVIDEVHAADDYMREYLNTALEWLAAYRIPVIMLSATLPSDQRTEFAEAYARGMSTDLDGRAQLEQNAYPSITGVLPDGTVRVVNPEVTTAPRTVQLVRLGDSYDALIAALTELLADGGCAAVIRNTVRRAQETARVLRQVFGDDVLLLHSSFIAQHRSDLERGLLNAMGKDGTRPPRCVVVATQVIEQSLDVDFDVMVSDLAPIDLLLQRIGRLHRHDRVRRPSLRQPRLMVTGVVDWHAAVPQPIAVSERVYRRYDLLRALAVLRDRDAIRLPDDIAPLVHAAYTTDFDPPPGWEHDIAAARSACEKEVAELKSQAAAFRIWSPHRKPHLVGWLKDLGSDPEDARGYARVRNSNDSIEVIVTRKAGGQVTLPQQCGGWPIDIDFEPDDRTARRARAATIKLPYLLSLPGTLDRVITELERRTHRYGGWHTSKWLKGELALELDGDMRTELCGYTIRYDAHDGLIVDKVDG